MSESAPPPPRSPLHTAPRYPHPWEGCCTISSQVFCLSFRCVEPLGWFQVMYQLGWRFNWRPRSLGLGGGQQAHRGPADHTASWQISFLGGLALNEGVNWLIKHVIQEPRPCGGRAQASGVWGSPRSGHYWEACILLSCPFSLPHRPSSDSWHQVRDAFQSFPVYVVFLCLLLPFPVFKVSLCPSWSGPELA